MKIVELKYKKFSYPLKNPLKISNQSITKKDVIIIKAKDEAGNFHYGEVSPLPGFSNESINECERKLVEITEKFEEIEVNDLRKNFGNTNNFPSLLFAVEQLIVSCNINKNESLERVVKLNRIIGIDSDEKVLENAKVLADKGFEVIKLKIGRSNFADDLRIITRLHNEYGSQIKLRLDNNGSWNVLQAEENIKLLSDFNIEYIEQPVLKTEDLIVLAGKSQIPISADESVKTFEDAVSLINNGIIKNIVIKPSIRLGVFNTIKLIELTNKTDVNIIISSAYETEIGRGTLTYLASMVSKNIAHGLNTEIVGSQSKSPNIDYSSSLIKFRYSDLFSTSSLDLI